MPDSQRQTLYTFFGRVHPERCDVSFSELGIQLQSLTGEIKGVLRCSVAHSQVAAVFAASDPVENVYTLKNIVEDAVRTALDAYGFTVGCGYDLEITQLVDSLGSPPLLFGVEIPAIATSAAEAGVDFTTIVRLFSDARGQYLQRCLANLREAIRVPTDTGFFCYRGVEAVRQFFVRERGADGDNASWEALRLELPVQRSDIDLIKRFADPIRHGAGRIDHGCGAGAGIRVHLEYCQRLRQICSCRIRKGSVCNAKHHLVAGPPPKAGTID